MNSDHSQLNTSTINQIAALNSALIQDTSATDLPLNDRYQLLLTALRKAQLRLTTMLKHCSTTASHRQAELQSQAQQIAGFIFALESFTANVDDELMELEIAADLADKKRQLEIHYRTRPAKRSTPQKTAPLFSGLSKEQRIRMMQG